MKRSRFLITAVPSATGAVALPAAARAFARRSDERADLIFTPLERQSGTITPTRLAFVRNHAGVPPIDAGRHRLLVHGLVERPLTFALADVLRFPAVERTHFIECAGNSARGWQSAGSGVQFSHGLIQSARWRGVPLRALLEEAGITSEARWVVAEGADDASFDRSLPIEACLDDALVVYGQNGDLLRPEHGAPLRLLLPGFEGSTNVKWLRRLKLTAKPVYSREETAQYSEAYADGKIHLFTFVMEVKSVIVTPSPGTKLPAPGTFAGRGFAWSGRGRIAAVEVSHDGGSTWERATLAEPSATKSMVEFRFPFRWDGSPAMLMSRATDETGAVQPAADVLLAARGGPPRYHANGIARWSIARDGSVRNLDG